MRPFQRFLSDQRGDSMKSVAGAAAIVAFAAIAMTQLLDRATKDGSLGQIGMGPDTRMASLPRPTGSSAPSGGQYDTAPVATIGGRQVPQVILDPCTGIRR